MLKYCYIQHCNDYVLYTAVSPGDGDSSHINSGKLYISLITCYVHTLELIGGVVGGVSSAVLAGIVLLSVCTAIKCYKNRNQ